MSIYHVTIDLINLDDTDEDGTYVYGVREWSKLGAIKAVTERVLADGYLILDVRAPRAERVGSDITWTPGVPLCYGKET